MNDDLMDPPEPPEGGGGLRAADLKNKVLILHPTAVLYDLPGKEGPYNAVECDVWVIDRAGIEERGTGVHFSWWKAIDQLEANIGRYIATKPMKEADSNAIVLTTVSDGARAVCQSVMAEVKAEVAARAQAAPTPPAATDEPGEEPF